MTETKRDVRRTSQFKKDYKKLKKQGKDIEGKDIGLLLSLVEMLANDESLPAKHRDHALTGNWKGFRECHVTPDWLLVYSKENDDELVLVLSRLASHSDLDF